MSNCTIVEIYEDLKSHPEYYKSFTYNPLIKFYDAGFKDEAKKFIDCYKNCIDEFNPIWISWWNVNKPELLEWLFNAGCNIRHTANLLYFEEQCKNVESFKVLDNYFPKEFMEFFVYETRVFHINNVHILEYFVDNYKKQILDSYIRRLNDTFPQGFGIPFHNLEVFTIWFRAISSYDKKFKFQFMVRNHVIDNRIINTSLNIPCDLILDNININDLSWNQSANIQIAMIDRGYELSDEDYKSIRENKVLEYLYDYKHVERKLILNAIFRDEYVNIFISIILGKVSFNSDTLFPKNKYKYVDLKPNVYHAVISFKHKHLKELISIGADLEHDFNGKTPLMQAITNQDLNSIKILLDAGANKESEIDGKNVLWYINTLSGQVQKQIMNLVFGEQIDNDELKKENKQLKKTIKTLKTRLENKDAQIDELIAKIKALEQFNDVLRHTHLTESHKNAVLLGMK